jgi:hypothetical protein
MNRLYVAKLLLEAGGGTDVNCQSSAGETPLMAACINRDSALAVLLLLKHGARLGMQNEQGETAIHLAVRFGDPASTAMLVKYLAMQNGGGVGGGRDGGRDAGSGTGTGTGGGGGGEGTVQAGEDAGGGVGGGTGVGVGESVGRGGNGIGGGGVSAIMAANGVPVADWTRTGSRLDENEPAPGSDGANGAVKNKTKKGSPLWGSVNLGDVINCPDLNGSTPAHAVASRVDASAVQHLSRLLEGGASLCGRDMAGRTPLMVAAGSGSADVVRAILADDGTAGRGRGSGKASVRLSQCVSVCISVSLGCPSVSQVLSSVLSPSQCAYRLVSQCLVSQLSCLSVSCLPVSCLPVSCLPAVLSFSVLSPSCLVFQCLVSQLSCLPVSCLPAVLSFSVSQHPSISAARLDYIHSHISLCFRCGSRVHACNSSDRECALPFIL